MNLKYAIQKKFPKSHAKRFRVWDEDNNELFDSTAYAAGDYDKKLLDKVVLNVSESTVLYSNETTMHITVETGAKRMQELIKAAAVIQRHCYERSECKVCPFWKDFCVLRDNAPSGWDLSEVTTDAN